MGIAALLAGPAAHDGKLVTLNGAAVVEFEGAFLCPDSAVIEHGGPKQCLWLSAAEGVDLQPFHLKNVQLTGHFDSAYKGHMGLFGGRLIVRSGKVLGHHGVRGFRPPPPPSSSANNSSKPTPLRGAA
ncbi:hypothetical protein ACQ259_15780 [Stutzerimonas stutzeri]